MTLALYGLTTSAVLMAVGWMISAVRRDVGVADALWGPAITATGVVYLVASNGVSLRGKLAVTLAVIWAVRLLAHVLYRNRGRPEDRRYREIRARNEPGFWWKSLYLVFALQAVLAWIVGLPLYGAVTSAGAPGVLDFIGALLWAFGLLFEVVADYQLVKFQGGSAAARGVMDQGLWRYSRHPNYFGEFCTWWGFYAIALGAGGAWTIFSPLLMSVLLLKVSGVALLERDIGERRPGYRQYVASTNAFFPGPRRAR